MLLNKIIKLLSDSPELLGALLEYNKNGILEQNHLDKGIVICSVCENFYPVEKLRCTNIECGEPNPLNEVISEIIAKLETKFRNIAIDIILSGEMPQIKVMPNLNINITEVLLN